MTGDTALAGALAAIDRRLAADGRPVTAPCATLASAGQREWLESAQAMVLRGEATAAATVLAAAARAHPGSREIRFALAGSLLQHGERGPAEALLRELLEGDPPHAAAAFLLARTLKEQGRMQAMATVMQTLFARGGEDVEQLIAAVELLDDAGRQADASALCEAHIARGCNDPRLHAYAGMLLAQVGQFALARERREFALDHDVRALDWEVPLGLAELQRYADDRHPDFVRFRAALERPGLGPGAQASLRFALAKAHDDVGQYAQAADYLARANALRHAQVRWPRKSWRRSIEARLRRGPLPGRDADEADWAPLFIVGMPRAGSTLLARLLARHPQVRSRGELPWLPMLADELLAAPGDYPTQLERTAARYAAQLCQDDAGAHWLIDKQPHNFLHVDVILAMFPRARILYCARNSRDTALSLWMQSFQPGNQDYAYDMGDIAAAIHGCQRLMKHWAMRFPQAIHRVRYEALTADPAQVLAGVTAWLGLPPHDLLAAPDRTEAIGTASLWQARQAVHTRSVARWRHYADYLPELLRLADD